MAGVRVCLLFSVSLSFPISILRVRERERGEALIAIGSGVAGGGDCSPEAVCGSCACGDS